MPRRHVTIRLLALLVSLSSRLLVSSPARADTHLLTFAGGPNPESNQTSLEQNVLYFRRTLTVLGLAKVPHEEFFADAGQSPHAVQIHVNRSPGEELTDDLAAILNPDAERDIRFRAAAIPSLAGPATLDALARWFDTTGKNLPPHSRLVFYFTGHGGTVNMNMPGMGGGPAGRGARGGRRAAPVADPRVTTLLLWDSPDVTVTDFEKQLDKLDPTTDVTLLMVQCHSGGFANVLYDNANPKNGLARQPRCGFFASTADRPAAGCTPDIDREDYEEFSTGFFAALSGITRDGKKIARPDYDGDHQTSLADAFAFVVLTSNTIDTPITTSDQFLRDNSSLPANSRNGLLGKDAAYPDLLAAADPFHKAILEGLSQTLELTGDNRTDQARALLAQIEKDRAALDRQHTQLDRQFENARNQLRTALAARWPELAVPLHPEFEKILNAEAPAMHKYLESLRPWQTYQQLDTQLGALNDQDTALEKKSIKLLRLLYAADSVALAHNLQKSGKPEAQSLYTDLLARENRPLPTN